MVQLVLVFCMLSAPNNCAEHRPTMEGLSLAGCMMQGQHVAQAWLSEHPNWSLSRWRCEQNVPRQTPI